MTALRLHQALGLGVELEPGEDLLVADAAARVGVHYVDELARWCARRRRRRVRARAWPPRPALRRRPACGDRSRTGTSPRRHCGASSRAPVEGDAHLGLAAEVEGHAAPVVRVQGLYDHGIAEVRCGADGGVGAAHQALARDGQARDRRGCGSSPPCRRRCETAMWRVSLGDRGLDAASGTCRGRAAIKL